MADDGQLVIIKMGGFQEGEREWEDIVSQNNIANHVFFLIL